MLNPEQTRELMELTFSGGANYAMALAQITRDCRIWDIEHPKSLTVLNDFSDRVGHMLRHRGLRILAKRERPAVSEESSLGSEYLQAADVAAGWAVNLLTLSGGDEFPDT